MVVIITKPPCKASMLGCSLIINHTQIGPIIVSSRKNRFTSSAGINLGAIVTKTKGIATHITHIKGTNIRSFSTRAKLSTKKKAKIATQNFPITAEGTRISVFSKSSKNSITSKTKGSNYTK